MSETKISRSYADARVQTIYGGSNEIMKELISRTIQVNKWSNTRERTTELTIYLPTFKTHLARAAKDFQVQQTSRHKASLRPEQHL